MPRPLLMLAAVLIAGCSGNDTNNDGSQVKVYKYDGSVQCETGGTSVEVMQRQLTDAGIHVFCGQKAGDGYGYAAVCGAGTGMINVYTIAPKDLPEAKALGFTSVDELPDYDDQACRPD